MTPVNHSDIQQFICDGYLKVANAFPRDVADRARAILWRDTGRDPDEPLTWTRPVIRLGDYRDAPFIESANTPRLKGAFDLLVGPGRWLPRGSLGTFPVRFPSGESPQDVGWQVDASFDYEHGDFMKG